MTVSFTYNPTLLIAQRLIATGKVDSVYLQAHKLSANGEDKIVIQDGNDFEEIGWSDTGGVVCYFRDIGTMEFSNAETDACYIEFNTKQKVRLVVFSEGENLNTMQLAQMFLSQLRGNRIETAYFDFQDVIREELTNVKLPVAPATFIFAADFSIEEILQLNLCLTTIDCSIQDLKLTKACP